MYYPCYRIQTLSRTLALTLHTPRSDDHVTWEVPIEYSPNYAPARCASSSRTSASVRASTSRNRPRSSLMAAVAATSALALRRHRSTSSSKEDESSSPCAGARKRERERKRERDNHRRARERYGEREPNVGVHKRLLVTPSTLLSAALSLLLTTSEPPWFEPP